MLENYYQIMGISRDAGRFKIAFRYMVYAGKFLKRKTIEPAEEFLQLNRAFEILRIPETRKYYDILLIQRDNNSMNPEYLPTKKYLKIIAKQMQKGNEKAMELTNNPDFPLRKKLARAWYILLLNYLFYFNPPGSKLLYIALSRCSLKN